MTIVSQADDRHHIFNSAPKTTPRTSINPPSFTKNINGCNCFVTLAFLNVKCFIFLLYFYSVNPNYMPDILLVIPDIEECCVYWPVRPAMIFIPVYS